MVAARAPIPVEIAEIPDERLPEPVEAAAYYLIAEALTNVTAEKKPDRFALDPERAFSSQIGSARV